jgi:bifunctional DNase/RNase
VIRLSLVGVRVEVPTNQPIVLLREDEGQRYLPIFIGPPEATAIVYALQGMETPRPMTHDLFKTVLDDLSIKLQQVVITELHDGTFYAEIELAANGGNPYRVSSRPSDAIALAVRYEDPVPIFAEEAVLDEAGVLFENEEEEEQIEQFREFLDQVRPEDFAQ